MTAKTSLAVGDPMAVFAYVLDSLPARVKVYPTENHYYFSFLLDGIRYAGNIKLDAQLRSEGKVALHLLRGPAGLAQRQAGHHPRARRRSRA